MPALIALRWIRRLVLLVVAVAVALYLVTCLAVWRVAREDSRPRSDAIVVLGASQFNGRPSQILAFRLGHALTLYRQKVAPRIITVGGKQTGDRYTEAAAGAAWLERQGVPASKVLAVGTGSDTLASLTAVHTAMHRRGWRSAVLVSDPWHMLRCRRMADDLGIRAATSPTRSGPAVHTRSTEIRYVLREAAGYDYYRVFHSDATRGPAAT